MSRLSALRGWGAMLALLGGLAATAVNAGSTDAGRVIALPQQGLRITLPAGFEAQEVAAGLLLRSAALAGIVLITPHEHRDLAALRRDAEAGLADGGGTELRLHGELRAVGESGLAGEFRGRLDGAPARAHIVGLINPFGDGLTVIAATTPEQYGTAHEALALRLARAIVFEPPRPPAIVDEWRQVLSNRRLARHTSSYSSSGGGYSGFQSSVEFHLCADGRFGYGARESGSTQGGGVVGSTRGGQNAQGRYEVIADAAGQPWLQLRYEGGRVERYRLTMVGGRTHLNGERYFRTETDRCA